MRNLNTVIFNSDLTVKQQTEKPIQAFSSYQNIVRAIVPYGTEYIPFAIFHATNDADDVSVPAQFILMVQNGTTTVDGETYYVYEQKVPEAVVASLRANKVEFVLSLWGKETNFIGVQRYDETVGGYNDTTYIAAQLLNDFPDASEDDYVRVFNTETDWQFDGTVWSDTGDTFEYVLEDYRSSIVEFALYRGKATGKPTHKPSNTEAIIDAINLKVSKTGDTMTGALEFPNANQTRLVLGDNNITTDGQINATTFDNGDQVSDAVKFSDLATLFDVTAATPVDPDNWLDAYATAIADKFDEYIKSVEVGTTFVLTDGTSTMTGNLDMGDNDIVNLDGIASVKSELDGKVPSTREIAGLALSADISLTQLKNAIGEATVSLSGLLSATDKQTIDTLTDLLTNDDQDNLVNTLQEILDIFANYQEGTDIVTALGGKVDKVAGKGLSENDFTTTLKNKLDGIDDGAEVNVQSDWNETDSNVDSFIQNKPSIYTQSELDGGQLDTRYYTEGQVDALLADKVNLSDLQTTLTLYTTNTQESGGAFDGYSQLVTSRDDARYNDTVVESFTTDDRTATGNSIITSDDPNNPSVVAELIADAGIIDEIANNQSIETIGQVRKVGGFFDPSARLRFRLFNSSDLVNPIATSGYTDLINNTDWENVFETAVTVAQETFAPTDRIVILYEAYGDGAIVGIRLGNADPARTVIPQTFDATINANNVIYDNTDSNLTSTDVKAALDELDTDKANTSHSHVIGDVTGLQDALDDKIADTEKGANNGVATLDGNGKVPIDQLPFALDDVLQGYYDNSTDAFYEEDTFTTVIPAAQDKLYIDLTSNSLYRYDGSGYVAVIEVADVVNLGDIPDVNITGLQDNYILKYDNATSKWVVVNHTLDEINDLNVSGVTDGQYLTYDNATSKWVATTLPTFSTTLADLDDTTITTPADNDFLVHDGTDWKNRAITKTDVGLNNVQNYGIATQAEAEAGTLDNEYMTPLKTAQHVDSRIDYYTLTIADTDWSGTDPVTAVKTVSGVLATDRPLIDLDLSSVAFADVETKQTEYAKLYRVAATDTDEITFYALEAPTESLDILIKVVR